MEIFPKHIVAVAGLVRNADGNILMLQSPDRGWEFPGGKVEEGESLLDALEREIHEETGICARGKALVGLYTCLRQPPVLLADFLCVFISGEPATSEESLQVEWLPPETALARITHPDTRIRLEKMLAFQGQVTYRAYQLDFSNITAPYTLVQEQLI